MDIALIKAAQNNDLEAIAAVVQATESRVSILARRAANRMGSSFAEHFEEFQQIGRIAVWDSLPRFAGDNVDSFYAFIYSTVEAKLLDAVRSERNSGADKDAVHVFATMLELAEGDPFRAEKLVQTVPPKGRRLSADRAYAARLAWQGTESVDHYAANKGQDDVTGDYFTMTLAEGLASTLGIPEDLITAADLSAAQREQRNALVRGVLETLGEQQREVLKYSFGIGGYLNFGHGDSGDDAALAEHMGLSVAQIRPARSKGLKAFAARYVKAVARDEAEAGVLMGAALANLSRGGRK